MGTIVWPNLTPEEKQRAVLDGAGGSVYKEYRVQNFAEIITVFFPLIYWSGVYFSWLSIKGHMQGFHGLVRTEMFATRVEDVAYVTFITIWSHPEALAGWLAEGYPVERMLLTMGIPADNISSILVRDFS